MACWIKLGGNYKDDSAAAQSWLRDLGNPYQLSIVDKDGRLGIDLGVTGAPETYIVDQQGMIRFKHIGVIDGRVWKEKLLPVLKKLGS